MVCFIILDLSNLELIRFFIARNAPLLLQANKDEAVNLNHVDITMNSLNDAARDGRSLLEFMEETEKLLRAENITIRKGSSQYTHLLFFQTTSQSRNMSRGALVAIETTRKLAERLTILFFKVILN